MPTVFTTVNLFDEIEISEREDAGCVVQCDEMVLPLDNTLNRAYKAFCVLTGVDKGISVRLKKRIPAGGGLGGGSSDASSLIQSLDIMYGTHLNNSALSEIAGKVGSDVFFFTEALIADGGKRFYQYATFVAEVEGRGEIVRQIDSRNDFSVLLVFPGVEVSTKEAYSWVDECLEKTKIGCPKSDFVSIYNKPVAEWKFYNDFTQPVCEKKLAVKAALQRLEECGADFTDMSGSGATVFGVFEDYSVALSAQKILSSEYQTVLS